MEHGKPVGQVFSYYQSGIHTADIMFNSSGILHRRRDIETSNWTSWSELSNHYEMPLAEIEKKLPEWNRINWQSGDDVFTSRGDHYQRYLKVEETVGGDQREAWVWALRKATNPVDLVIENGKVIAFMLFGREGGSVLVKPGCERLTPLKLWDDPRLSKAEYGVNHLGRHDVVTRDGIRLAADVWLPSGLPEGKKVPAILVRTPYGRRDEQLGGSRWLRFVNRGYALMIQDTRGREDSEGEWIPKVHEMNDGEDTLNWIARQSWSDGRVGMIGGSYLGYVQWAAAATGNPHLKAIVSYVTAGTPFVDLPRKGGTILSGLLAWTFMMAEQTMNSEALERDDWDEVLKIRPIKDIPQKVLGKEIPFWSEWMKHTDYDEFWARSDWSRHGDKVNVPSLLVSGWYDDNGMGTTEAWEMNEKHGREHLRMILGPWYHKANTTRDIHDIPFGNNAIRYDLDLLQLRWFDRFLKEIPNGVDQEARVEYYMVGENEWKKSTAWPPEEVEYTPFYFHSHGDANTSNGKGKLLSVCPGKQPPDTYIFHPDDPAPYLIDVSENECSVPENYREVELRDDVLVYTSEPLSEEMAIAGDIYAVLYVSSSARDTDFLVRLTDVDEQGNSIRLSDGIIRARYRHSFTRPEWLEPGSIEKIEIKMTKIANVFKKGHRIRVSVTSGAKNLAFPNHNTGNDPATDTEIVIATQRVYHDSKNASHIKLPVIQKRGI
ncbi:CocE/NonD family hydrolase [Paenactinomyces guangxiensis]|uniref:CocE/NonD family hydrolase n=2 Tax=Paenactinomyces guangxiensis TaxID=1490290 RepID=A0A7W2A8G6_9BACL|nr:CocE/NonD family hydrolase [Paenactinomyces guangxiensis]MBH8592844.1 CocE/NonD family hydrolase [Paenactinomyces guangxiensis]